MIGTTIGNYVVTKKIGEGGMGVVYVAEHPRIGRRVAIKVLLPEYSQNQEVVSRFFTEARASSAINNEHIIDIIDFGELPDGSSYIIMEWLDGSSLTDVLARDGAFPVERALHVARGIGRALAAAHNQGIVHRDLKPDNVFLVPRGDDREFVKVLDFGIAKLLGNEGAGAPQIASKTRTGAIIGTPMYMSPEQCRGISVDERSDIYALGVMVYQMLCGKVPFESEGLGELLLKHMTETPVSPRQLVPSIPENVERAILRALEKDPNTRYRRVEDFVAELGGQPTQVMTTRGPAARGSSTAPLTAPQSAVHAAASSVDTIGAAAGQTIPGKTRMTPKANPLWFVVPLIAVIGVAGAIALRTPGISKPTGTGEGEHAAVTPRPVEPVPAVPTPSAPPPPARVLFEARGTPAEAVVHIDGVVQSNPYAQSVLRDGKEHTVEITAPGYTTYKETVVLDAPRTVSKDLVAEPKHEHGKTKGKAEPKTAAKPDAKPEAKNDAPKPDAAKKTSDKSDEKTPIYKGTKGKLITEFPPAE